MAKFCTNCGNELVDDAKFCGKCGAVQAPAQNVTQNATENVTETVLGSEMSMAETIKMSFGRPTVKIALGAVILIYVSLFLAWQDSVTQGAFLIFFVRTEEFAFVGLVIIICLIVGTVWMLNDSRSAHIETYTFIADYFEFFEDVVAWQPDWAGYEAEEEYFDDFVDWISAVREGYSAISCPESMKSVWAKYGDILEYSAGIAEKLNIGIPYNDIPRIFSAVYMSLRYETVEENLYEKLVDCMKNENDHASRQWGVAESLAEEMHAYAELEQGDREAYEFDYNRAGKIYLDYEAVDVIYPSLYNTYDAFVIFKTGCVSGNRIVVVEAEIPGFTQKYQELFRLDSAYMPIYIRPPALTGELDLSSAKDAQINISVSEQDGTLIDSKSFTVTIKSKYDFDWYSEDYGISTQDDILCFLTPEASAITELKRQAIDEITDMTGGAMESFVGYQAVVSGWNHYTITYMQVAGLMRALYEMGVRYNADAFSISGSHQHILFPEDVIKNRSGLCIETSLVIASALQSAGMHAFLIFPPGHAQVAVEIWDDGEGQAEYFLIETTNLEGSTNNRQHFIENANNLLEYQGSTGVITYLSDDDWMDYLLNEVDYIIDCDDAQLLGLTAFAN